MMSLQTWIFKNMIVQLKIFSLKKSGFKKYARYVQIIK